MADSTMTDVSKMKVIDLRKELKSRGLSYAGDKAELIARLQGAMSQEDQADINLDSDEIDSDGVLEDEDDKSQNDILDDSAVDTISEELVLEEPSPEKQSTEPKPQRTLKRKITTETPKQTENKEVGAKKIVLNRTISLSSNPTKTVEEKKDIEPPEDTTAEKTVSSNKIKITADIDPKTRLEMRAKRFGLPVKMSDEQRKEARKQRFNQNTISTTTNTNSTLDVNVTGSLADNLDKFKKRAQRFGQSVSAIMSDIENKEKLEKRKAKFSSIK